MFNCEERFGLIPDPNGFACLTSTDPIVRCALHDWGLMRAAMLNEEISVEEYRASKIAMLRSHRKIHSDSAIFQKRFSVLVTGHI